MGEIIKKNAMRLAIAILFLPILLHAQQDESLVSRSRPGLFWFFKR